MEHERRYVLSSPLDPAGATTTTRITQVYLSDGSRLRQSTHSDGSVEYARIVKKYIGGSTSTETTVDGASKEAFDAALNEGLPHVQKVRRTYPHDGLVWEVDEFEQPLRLVIAEVEMDDPKLSFVMHPEVQRRVVVEVTGVESASNGALARCATAKPAVTCVVEDDAGRILLLHRASSPHGWGLPGGKVDRGESYARACARELREETSIQVAALTRVGQVPSADPAYQVTVFYCRASSPIVSISEEHTGYVWVNAADLTQAGCAMRLAGNTRAMIELWLQLKDSPDIGRIQFYVEK